MAATDLVTKRIHVGGLTSSITPAHIKDRFKSFGNVLDVEDLKADALGQFYRNCIETELTDQVNLDLSLSSLSKLHRLSL